MIYAYMYFTLYIYINVACKTGARDTNAAGPNSRAFLPSPLRLWPFRRRCLAKPWTLKNPVTCALPHPSHENP